MSIAVSRVVCLLVIAVSCVVSLLVIAVSRVVCACWSVAVSHVVWYAYHIPLSASAVGLLGGSVKSFLPVHSLCIDLS